MIEAVARDGYVVAQEFLPAAAKGDVRMFMMNGRPLEAKGKIAMFARESGDSRYPQQHEEGRRGGGGRVTDAMLRIADIVRPKLIRDGMFLVGLDIAGDKLMEVNVFSPGGLGSARKLQGVDFAKVVIEALERKAAYRNAYGRFANTELASM